MGTVPSLYHKGAGWVSSAYDVALHDMMPPGAGFTLLQGAASANYDRINAGVTKRHSYSITPKVKPLTHPPLQIFPLWAILATISINDQCFYALPRSELSYLLAKL